MDLPAIVKYGLHSGADFVEVRKEVISGFKICYHLDRTISATHISETGLGIRIAVEGTWSFVSSNDLSDSGIKKIVEFGIKAARISSSQFHAPRISTGSFSYPSKRPAEAISFEERIEVLQSLEDTIKEVDDRIVGADLIVEEPLSQKWIYTSEGTDLHLSVPRIYFNPRIIAQNTKTVSYRRNLGAIGGYEFFDSVEIVLRDFSERAVRQLDAKKSPEGRLVVLLDCPLTGVLAHEVLGHTLEGDTVNEGNALMHPYYQKEIGPEILSLVDDPTLQLWGSYHYDDEGVPAQKKVLINNGVVNEFITNSETASSLHVPVTGGSRAQSYLYPPLVRMSDIFIEPRDYSVEELLEDIEQGVYLRNIVGGHSDPVRGLYNFEICESYAIERGEITDPLAKSTVSGDILSTLQCIEGVGSDFELHAGFCYKGGQSVPVGIGGPHMKVEGLFIGGAV